MRHASLNVSENPWDFRWLAKEVVPGRQGRAPKQRRALHWQTWARPPYTMKPGPRSAVGGGGAWWGADNKAVRDEARTEEKGWDVASANKAESSMPVWPSF